MTRLIVAIAGRKHAGKSRTADRMVDHHGFTKVSPIDPGKRFAEELGFTAHSLWGPSLAREEAHPYLTMADGSPLICRNFLDRLSAAVRDMCPTILLEAALRGGGDRVNESIRLRVEFDAYKALGAKIIRRKGGIGTGDEYDQLSDIPDSEFDAVIPYMESLEQLHAVVDTLVDGWKAEVGR